MGFLDADHYTWDELFPVFPEYLWFEREEGDLGCVDFIQLVDGVFVYVVECTLDQFYKESVVLPRLCEHRDEVYLLNPRRKRGDSWKDDIS